ncbi:uncharacterized protein LOC118746501 [Rhagoletis pomonella]|uniref:uncharacterized protein LOC118746501 n=1 Tax=Rhagoletis pomonella TaxID=28610 RepID=UPI00178338BC|nr:uncharacterized protein LOC118746501 [Rhagoletis pomonella]
MSLVINDLFPAIISIADDSPLLQNQQEILEDDELKILLRSWNVEHMYTCLKEENIDVNILKILKFDHLKEILQTFKIGDRILFEFNFENWRNQINKPLHFHASVSTASPSCSANFSSVRSRSPASSPTTGSNSQDFEENAFVALATILHADIKSLHVKDFYKCNNRLDDAHRNVLINIIVTYYIAKNIHMSLQVSHYLENEILSLFPNEKLNFYRTEKRGKLYTKYCYLKKSFKNRLSIIPVPEENTKADKIARDDHAEEIIQHLKYDNLTAEEFESCWQASANYRIHQIKEKFNSIQQVFVDWPEYKKPNGYRLIDLDFGTIFPNHDNFLVDWKQKVLKLFLHLKRSKCLKDGATKIIISSMSEGDLEKGMIL